MFIISLIIRKQEQILATFAKHPTAVNQFLLLVCIIGLIGIAWKAIP